MNEQQVYLSLTLREQIKKKHLSQLELSKISGVRASTLHDYAYGAIPRGLINMVKLADTLEISLDELILGRKS